MPRLKQIVFEGLSMARFPTLPPAICFLLMFLLGLGLVVLIAWIYAYWLPELPDYDRWEALYRLVFYGLVLLLVLLLIKVVPASTSCARTISWPFASVQRLLPQKPAWEWLKLVGGTTLLGIVAGLISFLVTQSTQETALRLQDKKERQQLLTDYMNDMTQLLKGASYSNMRDELKVAISSRTLNTLEALEGDGSRQGYVLRFASRAFPNFTCPLKVDEKFCKMPANISLNGVSLKGFKVNATNRIEEDLFEGVDLREADLEGSDFTRANLNGAHMERANLSKVNFGSKTPFGEARFAGAKLKGSIFQGSDLSEVPDLEKAEFSSQDPTIFSLNTRFNDGFALRICDLKRQGLITFTDKGSSQKESGNLKKRHNLSCDPL